MPSRHCRFKFKINTVAILPFTSPSPLLGGWIGEGEGRGGWVDGCGCGEDPWTEDN